MNISRYSAFTHTPEGGNPAGVVLDASGASDETMQRMAAEVGYSESAFITDQSTDGDMPNLTVRYFSPEAEVDFCGHATIATAVAYADLHGPGDLLLHTKAGPIGVMVQADAEGYRATLTSVPTALSEVDAAVLDETLAILGWSCDELDPALPPKVAFGGVDHLVLAADSRQRLADLDYDFERLKTWMSAGGWTTLQLVWRESPTVFHARNPFPVGGVVEDPATGAAAAAFGGYVRDLGLLPAPATFVIHQGHDMGRPSHLTVDSSADDRRIRVTGSACKISGD